MRPGEARIPIVRWLTVCATLLVVAAPAATQAPAAGGVDAVFAAFFAARTPKDAAAAVDAVIASGVGFDEALRRLRQGRTYSNDVPRGVVPGSYRGESGEYYYTLDVPESYDPARSYQVRIQLHGGVGRIDANTPPRPGTSGRLAGAEQIYVMPTAWKDAPWWSARQVENLGAILDAVKRAYNVDENRVVLSGVSDGGTGVYYMALRDTTPFASFLPLNGFFMVLKNEAPEADGDFFPGNFANKPFFVVNGGRDPQYPTSLVDPYIDRLKASGVEVVYRPQPNAAHDVSWWPDVKDEFEQFVAAHPRRPLPDTLTWQTGPPNVPSRAHWLIIDRLAATAATSLTAADGNGIVRADANRMATRALPDFGIRSSGAQLNGVVNGSNAQQIGLRSGDRIVTLNNQPVSAGTDVAEALRSYPPGRPLIFTVSRGGETLRLTGRYAPTVLPGEAIYMFPPQRESGQVDLKRTGNRVDAYASGVGAFTLLLSPDQFDLSRAVTVVVNGRTLFEGIVGKDVKTLLKWAARDNDRTMLFAAELRLELPQ